MTTPRANTGLGSAQQPPTSNRGFLLLVFVVSFAISMAIRAWVPAGWSRGFEFALLVVAFGGVATVGSRQLREWWAQRHPR